MSSKKPPLYHQHRCALIRKISLNKVHCLKLRLHRQVGSQYFVSASNACKILYLRHAAIEFLKFTGKDAGNKLERELLLKQDSGVTCTCTIIVTMGTVHVVG